MMLNKLFPFKPNLKIQQTSERLERALIDNGRAVTELRDQLRNGETHITVVKTVDPKPKAKSKSGQLPL